MTSAFLLGCMLVQILQPDAAESVSERRKLTQFPQMSAESVLSGGWMADFEDYALDQFPARDRLRTVKAAASFYLFRQKDNNDIYLQNGYAAKLEYPLHEDSVHHATARFRYVYERYLQESGARVFCAMIPDKSRFLAEAGGYPAMDYGALTALLQDDMEFAAFIDLVPLLDETAYYRTDTHWRQEALPAVARALAGAMGVTLSAEYETVRAEQPFYGVYFGQSALPLPADTLCYLTAPYLEHCRVYDYETDADIPVYDLERLSGNDPYEVFLSGSKSLLRIENPDAPARDLICFRDSFGSSIAPLLAEGYRTVTLVDIRYIAPELLGQFIDFGGQDVLFLYSSTVLNHSNTIK